MDPCTYFHARCHGWCFLVGVGFSLSVLCLFLIGQLASHFILSGPIPWRLRQPCRARLQRKKSFCVLPVFCAGWLVFVSEKRLFLGRSMVLWVSY